MKKPDENKLRNDFRVFMTMLWREMALPDPSPQQMLFAYILQHEKARLLIMLGFRGFAKTLIAAAYTCWLLYRDPKLQVTFWSSSAAAAESTTRLILMDWIMQISWLQHMAPGRNQKQSDSAFDVAGRGKFRGASVEARGIEGQITGSRSDFLVVDDPETSSNGASLAKRVTIDRALEEASYVIKDGGLVRVLGTVHFDDSLYVRLTQKGYKLWIFPIAVPNAETQKQCWGHYPKPIQDLILELDKGVPGSAEGKSLDRFSNSEIELKRSSVGLISFERQLLCNPFRSSLGKKPLDLRKAIIFQADLDSLPIRFVHHQQDRFINQEAMSLSSAQLRDKLYSPESWDEKCVPYDKKILIVDPAGGGKDETAVAVVGAAGGHAVLFASFGMLGGSNDENLLRIINTAITFKVDYISVESNFGMGMFGELLRAVYRREYARYGRHNLIPIQEHRSSAKKETRIISALDPVINFGRLVICPGALEMDFTSASEHQNEEKMAYRLTYQISYFQDGGNKLEYDDRIDAFAEAVNQLRPFLMEHPEDKAETWEDRLIKKAFADPLFDVTTAEISRKEIFVPQYGLNTRKSFLR